MEAWWPWTLKMEAWMEAQWSPRGSLNWWSQISITLKRSCIRIRIKMRSWIRIRIKVKSWIRIRIKMMRIRNPDGDPDPG